MRQTSMLLMAQLLLQCFGASLGLNAKTVPKFLIVSAPQRGKVTYAKLNGRGEAATEMLPLIEVGLGHPQGLAVDAARHRLFVAEPEARKIFAYNLTRNGDQLTAGPQEVVADGTEARWVATDAFGNVLFTDEPANKVFHLSAERIQRGHKTPEELFSATSHARVSSPGGIATDGINALWVNKALGTKIGSVVSALQSESHIQGGHARPLSKNVEKSYGVCLAMNNVFYTQPDKSIYGVKRRGGDPTLISDRLSHPRGCAWDGQNTVYVADRGTDTVYSFPGAASGLGAMQMSVAAHAEDAFGVAVYSSSWRLRQSMSVILLLLVGTQLF
eukprot:CAMPEP_0178423556 /NCGR_PEP_ID=MMETSP0689_2-20121128/27749_1 /TAXON_ID=160604 /ORGANISM="Amphidinium massartii, Strain CS-259" /LENGTH=329 /DNA_ID=CAMNT_0020045153 /DNA_START=58 /DNA_END=1047 /DNA_ORIENTATION=+